MIKTGITGGIGSGKTSITKIFEILGVPVYNADFQAKKLINSNEAIISAISDTFGNNIYQNGKIDRAKLAGIVFNNKEALQKLNQIVHPEVQKDYEKWLENHADCSYTLKEAALLFESESYKLLEYVICVYAPEEIRIERIIKRDNVSKENVLSRIQNQLSDKIKISKSNAVIYNDDKQLVIPQVLNIHKTLINKSMRKQNIHDFKN